MRLSSELAQLLQNLNDVLDAQRSQARRFDRGVVAVTSIGLVLILCTLAVLGNQQDQATVNLRFEALTVELQKELEATKQRCDQFLLALGSDVVPPPEQPKKAD